MKTNQVSMEKSSVNIDRARTIEGWMSDLELTWLAQKAQEKIYIVEIGSYKGRSARALADNINPKGIIYCVDPWTGIYPGVKPEINCYVYNDFERNLSDHIKQYRVIPVRAYSDSLNLPHLVDMFFIDGNHTYEGVKTDIGIAKRYLRPEGLLSGHDYNVENWPDTVKAVDELVNLEGIIDTIWWGTFK